MSERLYALILRLYPRPFRERYANEMMRVFRDRLNHEGGVRVWLDVLGDAVVSIPRQHFVQEPHPYYPPSAAPLRGAYAVVMQALIVSAILGAVFSLVIALTFFVGISKTWPLAVLLIAAWWITCRKAHRASQTVKAMRAEATSDAVTVAYAGVEPLTLRRSEIIGLHEFEYVGLRIETADPARDLWVPARAESYAAVKARLGQWVPVRATPHPVARALTNVPLLAIVLISHALLITPTIFGLAMYLLPVVPAMAGRDVPLHRKLLWTVPFAIHLVRWLRG